MLLHSDAIVLRKLDYGDTSLIASVLTESQGKVSFMVRGARKPKSPFAGLFEPGNLLSLVYYDKPNRDLQTLKEAAYAEHLFSIRATLESMALVAAAMELAGQLVHDHEPNPPVYETLRRFLVWLDASREKDPKAFAALQIRLADAMGIGIQTSSTGAAGEDMRLDVTRGMLCRADESEGGGNRLSPAQAMFVASVLEGSGQSALRMDLPRHDLRGLIHHLDLYFSYHFEGLKPRASDRVFEQLMI